MEIKNFSQLIALLDANGGKLSLGYVEIKKNAGDIDINVNDKLVSYAHQKDTGEVSEQKNWTLMSDFIQAYEAKNEKRGLEKELETKNTEIVSLNRDIEHLKAQLVATKNEGGRDSGKIEAYEKLLIGRNITISA